MLITRGMTATVQAGQTEANAQSQSDCSKTQSFNEDQSASAREASEPVKHMSFRAGEPLRAHTQIRSCLVAQAARTQEHPGSVWFEFSMKQ